MAKSDFSYYFAYGSNMNHSQMKSRCPNSVFLDKVYLIDYKFVYDGYSQKRKGAVANIVELRGGVVWGGLFQLQKDDLSALDYYEGYPTYYLRKKMKILDVFEKTFLAWVYFREPKEIAKPSDEYRNAILQGAMDCNLPREYINITL